MIAIILSRRDSKEDDQIVSIYTKKYGKQELIARGVKKIISNNSTHLEPCTLVDIEIASGKEWQVLITSNTKHYFRAIREDLKKSIIAEQIVTLTNHILKQDDKDEGIFSLLSHALYRLEQTSQPSLLLIDTYIIRLLECLGFSPQIDTCAITGDNSHLTHFLPAAGGFISHQAFLERTDRSSTAILVSKEALLYVPFLFQKGWEDIAYIPTEHHVVLHRIVYEFLIYHQEKHIPDWFRYTKIVQSL